MSSTATDAIRAAALLTPLATMTSPAVLASYAGAGLAAVRADLAALPDTSGSRTRVTLTVAEDVLAALVGFLPRPAVAQT